MSKMRARERGTGKDSEKGTSTTKGNATFGAPRRTGIGLSNLVPKRQGLRESEANYRPGLTAGDSDEREPDSSRYRLNSTT